MFLSIVIIVVILSGDPGAHDDAPPQDGAAFHFLSLRTKNLQPHAKKHTHTYTRTQSNTLHTWEVGGTGFPSAPPLEWARPGAGAGAGPLLY
jgi:hypothetical protein